MTLGEKIVMLEFNPANSERVHQIKTKAAELINLLEEGRATASKAGQRQISIAITSAEQAALHGVKSNFIKD